LFELSYELKPFRRAVATNKLGPLVFESGGNGELGSRDNRRRAIAWYVGKTLINASVWREIYSVEERGTLGEGGLDQADASYVVSTGASIGPAWAPTAKLVFQGKVVHEKRKYQGSPGLTFGVAPVVGTGEHREDTFNGLRLSAGYTPIRALRLSLSAEHGKRDSNAFLRDYDYNLISANARFQF